MKDIILQLKHSKSVLESLKQKRKFLRIDVFVMNDESKEKNLNFVEDQIKIETKIILKLIDKL